MSNLNELRCKKLEKKKRKCEHVVVKEVGVICTDTPTKHIVICNAGLVNGLSEVVVAENFIKYGPIENITMIPGKSCCFVTYNNIDSSIQAYKSCSGLLEIAQNNKPVILSFCEKLPIEHIKPTHTELPPGLQVLNDFITKEEELNLIALCNFEEKESNHLKFRQVKHYGYEFKYDTNNVEKNNPLSESIPNECDFLWDRLETLKQLVSHFIPDQLTVNYYKPGQGIPSHVDTHSAFEDPLVSVSLCSPIVMEFKHDDGRYSSVLLPQRSLAIISGESRYNWTHGITPRNLDIICVDNQLNVIRRNTRISFTFRKIRKGECNCAYKNHCDSFARSQNIQIDNSLASTLENTHVHKVYENIASHFSETRHKPWPGVLNYIQSLEVGSILVDIGCGNGKYLGQNKDVYDIGCDRSFNLIQLCKEKDCKVFTCNCLNVPLKDESADAVISIAVIHHLANEERRLQAIKEIVRILRINGTALIYVWAKDQNKDNNKTTYLKQDRKNRKKDLVIPQEQDFENLSKDLALPIHTNRSQFKHKDLLVPWKLKKIENETTNSPELFLRFYHVFDEGELNNLCTKLNNIHIIKSFYDEGNWCVMFKKNKP